MSRLEMDDIPADFPVVPVTPTHPGRVYAVVTCGECGLSWDDTVSTQYTPAPSGRCPFEAFHEMDEPDEDEIREMDNHVAQRAEDAALNQGYGTWFTITREYNGAPNGPKFIVRRHAQSYEGWHETLENAAAWVAEQNGRVAR